MNVLNVVILNTCLIVSSVCLYFILFTARDIKRIANAMEFFKTLNEELKADETRR